MSQFGAGITLALQERYERLDHSTGHSSHFGLAMLRSCSRLHRLFCKQWRPALAF